MALDILHDNWGPYTHTEVENALKAYLAVLENRINQAIQSGGVGLADLSAEVQALLAKANTALQPENLASWAKQQNKPGYTVGEITYDNLTTLAQKLAEMDQAIQVAAQSGADPDIAMSDSSTNTVQNKVVKAYIDAVSQRIDTLIGSGNVQGAIDTFNEVTAFLNGISSSDTLAAKLAQIQQSIPDTSGLATKTEVQQGLGTKQDTLTFDNAPTAGSNNPVKSSGIFTALNNLLSNITIDATTGNWKVGNTDTGIRARGIDGVSSGDDVVVVHDLEGEPDDLESGQVAVLGADMGEVIAGMIEESGTSGGGLSAAFVGDTLVITNSEDLAYIKVSKSSVSFPQTEENDTSTKTIVVTGRNLTSGITLVLSGTDAAMFSLSTNSIAAADANSQNSITVTYAPTAVGSHSASITLISGDVMNSLSISGTCVEEIVPSILINLGESILLAAEEGETSTQIVPITAENLTPFAVVAISNEGSEFSVSPASITADEDGTIDSTITVEYTAGSADSTDTITASCTDVTATASVEGSVRTRLAQGSYWTDNSGLKYTVQTNTKNVSVVAGDSFVANSSVDLTIPATANDTGMTVYDSGGNVIPASGLTYNVKSIGMRATTTGGFEGKSLHDVIVSEGITSIGARAFFGSSSSVYALNSIVLPSTLTSWGTVSNASWALRQRNVKKVVINGSSGWAPYITNSTALEWLEFGQNVANCSGNNAEWLVKSGGKIVIRKTGSKLALTSSFFSSATYGNATVYVPDDLLSTYQADSAWSAFSAIKGLSELTE